MRQILVNYAKASQSQKRGGGALKVELDEAALISPEQTTEILDLHEALERLATLDSRKAHVVELKYFGGLNHDEIAEVLKISTVTVDVIGSLPRHGCTRNCTMRPDRNDEARMTNGFAALNRKLVNVEPEIRCNDVTL